MKLGTAVIAVLLLLILPLQGLAAVLNPLLCLSGQHQPAAMAMAQERQNSHAGHEHDQAPVTASTDHYHDHGGEADNVSGGHLCCHHAFTGALPVHVMTGVDAPSVYTASDSVVPVPFFSERLPRPPRA
ncbi:MAG: hypothetical protein KIT18_11690 [Burkholderiales bacterium]|nr:hypothetical protein [Burkholderiales bacterium]